MSGPKTHRWVNELNVYAAGKSKAGGDIKPVKLSANESAIGPSPMAVEAYKQAADKLHRYPDPVYTDLRKALSEKYNIEAGRIFCGVGSDDLLKVACRAYLTPGDEAIYVDHSFLMYPIAIKSVGGVPIKVADENYTTNVDTIISAITDKTRIIFVANPNNPTGTYIDRSEIERLWKNIPDHVLLVLDSAYAEFVSHDDYEAGIELVEKSNNVLMTRTFSKLYGLASLRLGWGYACREIADTMDKTRDPFNVPNSSQVAAVAALKDVEFEKRALAFNEKWLCWLTAQVSALGLKVIPSTTNFIMIKFEDDSRSAIDANEFLLSRGYILRYFKNMDLDDFLRLTIGTEEENKAVVELLKEFMEK